MADHHAHNAAVSEKHARFVIAIEYTGMEYYTLWGTDMSSPDEEDKVLTNDAGHFLLFKTPEEAIAYAKTQRNLFDQNNFDAWLDSVRTPVMPHMRIDLDLLQDEEIDIDTEESFEELINVQNFVSDYAHQTNDDYFIDLFYEHPLETLFDLYIDTYIDEVKPPSAPGALVEDAVPKLNELYDILSKKIKVIV